MSFKITKKSTKRAKYALGKNLEYLMHYQKNKLDEIREVYLKFFKRYPLKEGLRKVFQCKGEEVEEALSRWLSWTCRCRIPSFVELSRKIQGIRKQS